MLGCSTTAGGSAGKWQASIRVDGRSIYLGTFDVEQDAALAYNQAARKVFKSFAQTNAVA